MCVLGGGVELRPNPLTNQAPMDDFSVLKMKSLLISIPISDVNVHRTK